MAELSVGSVVLVAFPFSDLSAIKLRPCLILGVAEHGDIIVCQITSQPYASKQAISLGNSDFINGSIVTDSFIRVDKIATLDRAIIKRVLGKINTSKLATVKTSLTKLFQLV